MSSDLNLSKEFEYCLRILKSSGITKGEVAKRMSISSGHLSRMISGKEPITRKNIELFNELFSKLVTLDPENFPLLNDPEVPYKSLSYYQELASERERAIEERDRTIASLNYTIDFQKGKIAELEKKLVEKTTGKKKDI